MSQVRLENIDKNFGNTLVLPQLSLTIDSGEFLSLLGPSGCGKTTVLRAIAGLDHPTKGLISIDNEVVFDDTKKIAVPPENRHLGMVFQNYAIWPHLTVYENVAFPLKCRKVRQEEISPRVTEALAIVQLESLASRKPNQLSGGQQQRVALARALVSRPKVILLDEPLCNLDANLRDAMCDEIRKIHTTFKSTMIYVTHDQSEAFRLSHRVAIMNRGVIEQLGSVDEIKSKPANEFVRTFLRR